MTRTTPAPTVRGRRHRLPVVVLVLLVLAPAAAALAQAASGPAPTAAPGAPADDPCVQGKELYRAGKMREARTALLACLERDGARIETLLPLTVMAVREGRVDEALDFGGRAASLAPDDPEARYWHGRALLRAGRVADAKAEWEAGLQLTFDHPGILEGLARLALQEGQNAKAYNLLTQLQRQGVDDAWLHGLLAEIAAGKGLWDQALGHLEDAMARETPGPEQLISASEMSILAGQHDRAVGYCRRAVALQPGGRTWGSLGEAFFAAEELDSALVWLRKAADDPTAPPRVRFNLANALEVAGLFDEAGTQFRAFLAGSPDDAMGHFNYGIHLEQGERPEEALDQVDQALKLDPDLLNAYIVKAQILENLGRYDAALSVVGMLGARDPGAARELAAWEQRLRDARDGADQQAAAGKIHLLHMVLGTAELAEQVQGELAKGGDFAELTVRYSQGPAAARGGDVGWIDPAQMAEPLRSAVERLGPDAISPPVEAGGLQHIFKRIR
ncbi:MAG TPA: tetratricopeptide repeat protein [Candidatus Krumholzibacteria bacterium]|nr:tetratricopeptide repeat protein [Candidatus Krumholzibacteria bacterium]